eukprot:15327670-Ditylum_brightwellii.AAC.1
MPDKHFRADNSVGKSKVIALQWAQLCTFLAHHILQDTRLIPHLEEIWITHLCNGMHHCGTTITFQHKWTHSKQHENDRHIMDVFMDSLDTPAAALPTLNYVRYYVEATTFAELSTSGRQRIKPELFNPKIFTKKVNLQQKVNPKELPRHSEPDREALWTRHHALINTICNSEGVLTEPLGQWIQQNNQWNNWFYQGNLYIRMESRWREYKCTNKANTRSVEQGHLL